MNVKKLSSLEISSLVLAGVLFLCLLSMPYGFYTVIRLATAIIASLWAIKFFNQNSTTYAIVAIAVALLFQPFFKVTLDRLTWNIIDIIVSIGLIICVLRGKS